VALADGVGGDEALVGTLEAFQRIDSCQPTRKQRIGRSVHTLVDIRDSIDSAEPTRHEYGINSVAIILLRNVELKAFPYAEVPMHGDHSHG